MSITLIPNTEGVKLITDGKLIDGKLIDGKEKPPKEGMFTFKHGKTIGGVFTMFEGVGIVGGINVGIKGISGRGISNGSVSTGAINSSGTVAKFVLSGNGLSFGDMITSVFSLRNTTKGSG